jgi:hypothetical protein
MAKAMPFVQIFLLTLTESKTASGAKALRRPDYMARLKSCPDTKPEFFANLYSCVLRAGFLLAYELPL